MNDNDPGLTLSKDECNPAKLQTASYKHITHSVQLDPYGMLTLSTKQRFQTLLMEFDHVFHLAISGYNGVCGPFEATYSQHVQKTTS